MPLTMTNRRSRPSDPAQLRRTTSVVALFVACALAACTGPSLSDNSLVDASTCTPACDGKACGDSDDCGGVCEAGCGTGDHCDATTCTGCCDPSGQCLAGDTSNACGIAGDRCSVCSADEPCNTAGSCGNGTVVLFGGSNATSGFHDTWTFNGTSWTQVMGPGPDGGSAMATLGNTVVLFDGTNMWSFDGTAWTKNSAIGPSPRGGVAMATLGDHVVLFGGRNGNTSYAETWTFDGVTWTQIPGTGPSARYLSAMSTLGGKVVLFGGEHGNDETWTFDGTTWTKLAAIGPTKVNLLGPNAATVGSMVALFAYTFTTYTTDTWLFDGTSWMKSAATGPAGRFLGAMTHWGTKVLLFGGQKDGESTLLGDTWLFDGTGWARQAIPGPSARRGHVMAWLP